MKVSLLLLVDFLLVWVTGHAALSQAVSWSARLSAEQASYGYGVIITAMSLAYPTLLRVYGGYERRAQALFARGVMRALSSWGTAMVALLLILWANKLSDQFSRLWLGLWFVEQPLILLAAQWAYHRIHGWYLGAVGVELKAVVIGGDLHARSLIRETNADDHNGFHVVGYFGASSDDMPVPCLGDVAGAVDAIYGAQNQQLDEIWIMQSEANETLEKQLFARSELRLYQIRLIPSFRGFEVFSSDLERIGRHSLVGMSVSPQRGIQATAKRIIDFFGSALGLLALAPLLACIALAIKLESPGGVFFKQQRHGLQGRPFWVWKFRTMYVEHSNERGEFVQVRAGDQRVTRVGRVLRRTSLDELPQLINVLGGQMSLVGPRPHPIGMNETGAQRDFRYALRHKVKPGISGWAQVNGYRGETTDLRLLDKRLEYDLYYIEHWTLGLDIRILVMTLFVGFVHPNAY